MSARVLVVDDVAVNVRLLEAKLFTEYYDVLTAFDGPSALESVRNDSPDIVLLDVLMPGMDGFEVCQAIKSDPETAHIPVVMVTALDEISDRVRGLEAGADDFLTKPVNDIALFSRIRSLVRLKHAIDELRAREATALEIGAAESQIPGLDDKAPGNILLVAGESWDQQLISEALEAFGHNLTVIQDFGDAARLPPRGISTSFWSTTALATAPCGFVRSCAHGLKPDTARSCLPSMAGTRTGWPRRWNSGLTTILFAPSTRRS